MVILIHILHGEPGTARLRGRLPAFDPQNLIRIMPAEGIFI